MDLLFLTETWFKPVGDEVRVSQMTPPNHCTDSFPRTTGQGGGISITFKNVLQPAIKNTSNVDFQSFELSRSDLLINNHHFTLFCVYRPPPSARNQLTNSQFLNEFEHFIDSYTLNLEHFLIVGDFNLHFDNMNDTYVKKMLNVLHTRNMTQLTMSATHKAGHILDWIITRNDRNDIFKIEVFDNCISDHFMITFRVNIVKPKRCLKDVMSRNIRAIDFDSFNHDLALCNTRVLSAHVDTCKASIYNSELSAVMDSHAPMRTRRVTDRPSAPWMTGELKSLKRDKRRAERRWRSTGLTEDKTVFKSLLSRLNILISEAKKFYYESKILTASTSRYLFQFVSDMYGKSKTSIFPNNINIHEMPEIFNAFFVQKISKIREKFDCTDDVNSIVQPCSSTSALNTNHLTEFKTLTCSEVKKIILSSPAKSCSLDPIPTQFLFQHIDVLIDSVTTIVNDSLISGVMPLCFRQAIISPLIKKPNLDQNELKNYRPVSNLSFLSKVIEKAVSAQLTEHLLNNSLFEPHQSAYRKFHNTETALVKITNDLLLSADERKVSVLALLDLSAAFDTIDHSLLIQRLELDFGLKGNVLNWFRTYLEDRTQCVKIGTSFSSSVPLPFGVPQGSVLGPLLYTLYTVPLGQIIRKHGLNYHFYADDTQLYLCIEPSDVHDLIFSVEKCIDDIKQWMHDNKLKLNDEKTEVILINPKHYEIPFDHLTIGTENIDFADSAKNLGVYIDKDLSMECHISNLSKAVYLEIRKIKTMSRFVSQSCLKTLATSFILSRIDYCNALFKNLNKYQIESLQKLQNFAAKVVLGKSLYDHVTPCLIELHWLPVAYRIDFKISLLTFKCLNGLAPSYLSSLIEIYNPNRNLRSASKFLLKEKVSNFKKIGEKCFSFSAPKVWNKLPISIRSETSIETFKRKLKTFYFQEAYQI